MMNASSLEREREERGGTHVPHIIMQTMSLIVIASTCTLLSSLQLAFERPSLDLISEFIHVAIRDNVHEST